MMKWQIIPADRYGNSDIRYYCDIGGRPNIDARGAHCSIAKSKGGYVAKIEFTDTTARPWKSNTQTVSTKTLNEAKQWCEETYTELRSALG